MKILFVEGNIWAKTDEEKTPLMGNFVLCPENQGAFYVDSTGQIWSLSTMDYELFKKWYADQESLNADKKSAIEKVKLSPLNTTDAAHMVFNNCNQITINK